MPLAMPEVDRATRVEAIPRMQFDHAFWAGALLCFGALCFAITGSSLWIDEGFSAWMAAHRSLPDLFDTLRIGDVSDRQMPLHYIWLWLWSHGVGSSEASLRAANLPFAAIYVIALALVSKLVFDRRFAWIPFALSPFAWWYLNEARAYFMLLSLATAAYSALIICLIGPARYRTRAAWLFASSFFLACLTHMLTVFLVPAALVLACWYRPNAFERSRWLAPLSVFGIPMLMLGGYYAVNLSRDTAYQYGSPSIGYFALALYEHAGFAGLGPPRNMLRTLEPQVFRDYWMWTLVGAAVLVYCAASALRRGVDPRARPLALAWMAAFSSAIAAAYFVDSRFLGRHVAALAPVLFVAGMAMLTRPRQWVALALIWGASDIRCRLLPQYDKDDYRSTVGDVIARHSNRAGLIAWAADPLTANYYGLQLEDRDRARYYEFDYAAGIRRASWPFRARGVIAENWKPDAVRRLGDSQRALGAPIYLALSKPDIYDAHAGWARLLGERHATPVTRYPSFDVYLLE